MSKLKKLLLAALTTSFILLTVFLGTPGITTQKVFAQDDGSVWSEDTKLTQEKLSQLDPLKQESSLAEKLSTPSGIINRLLEFIFPIAGVLLFVIILWGGFEILSGAATKKSMDAGKQRVTAGLIGFLLLFASYWIIQIIEGIFGVVILGF
ncbi:MAG: hypothetical protein PVJ09_04330 [Candidatus Woesebacteria bacterium]|jgi:hypothetical protein